MNRNKKRFGTRSPVTGDRTLPEEKFKAAVRQLDLYVGNVAKDVKIIEIKNYIQNNFNAKVSSIASLEIKTKHFNAFKVTLSATDIDSLFQSTKWPKGLVINKFFNRNSKPI